MGTQCRAGLSARTCLTWPHQSSPRTFGGTKSGHATSHGVRDSELKHGTRLREKVCSEIVLSMDTSKW